MEGKLQGLGVLVALACATAWSSMATAQTVNIESRAKDEPGFGLLVKGALTLSTGNTKQTVASASGRVQYQLVYDDPDAEDDVPAFLKHRWLVIASGAYESANDAAIVDERFAHARWTAMWLKRLGSEVFTQYQFKDFSRLQARILTGVGARLVLVHLEDFRVAMGSGYMLEYEQLQRENAGDSKPDDTIAHRWTNFLGASASLFDGVLGLANTVYAQPRFDDFGDFRILNEFELSVAVTKVLSFGTEFQVAHDSRPPSGVEATDIVLSQNIAIQF